MENRDLERLQWPLPGSQDAAGLYLELLKRVLTGLVRPQSLAQADVPAAVRSLAGFGQVEAALGQFGLTIARPVEQNLAERVGGTEWIPDGDTMIGLHRLDNIHQCLRTVIEDGVPGDFIETGVWRGGACIFARACLQAYGDTERTVWLADSFQGLPPPTPHKYPADLGDLHSTHPQLAVSRADVEENFRRYGLLDDRVKFLEGWFKDTLAGAPIEKIAVMRLDGDMYESTMDALVGLYDRLSVGGFAIIDDYSWHKPCAMAVEDFRTKHGITEAVIPVDRSAVYWRRER